ncbi:TetR/AcrR family transcriptional regulator [Micromonospora sp. NBC_01796]|uniref:TetR/AcrR family transcriptional regulator n=1 Tax=Micromonospora sp. NBC_01796 TaxID=2975987 RepID=UPI002DDB1D87|nr:TetR/AcrR family transcriptional regulator [Micromonospora sp. NBC_01796]WSA85696.1 TetR/AcrR family transcriptional regulator [Micromonospora sp. NBC_01796]
MTSTRRPAASPERRESIEAGVIAAIERLLKQGASFTELTMQQIAAEAGVARSTLYLYFQEKTSVLIPMSTRLGDGAFDIINGWDPREPSGLDGLTEALLRVIAYYRERAHVLAAITEVSGYDRTVREHWQAELGKFIDLSQTWLRTEQEAGRTSADLDPRTASQVIVHGGNQAIADHVANGDPARDRIVAQELAANQWFGGLRRSQPSPS